LIFADALLSFDLIRDIMADSIPKSSGTSRRDFSGTPSNPTWVPVVVWAILIAFVAYHFYLREMDRKTAEARAYARAGMQEEAESAKGMEDAQKQVEAASKKSIPPGPMNITIPSTPDSTAKTNAP
jgi:hypothetical protein